MKHLRRSSFVAAIAIAGAVGIWHWGDSGGQIARHAALGGILRPDTSAVATTIAGATRTPQIAPLTPVSVRYEIADPPFEPLPGSRALYGTHEGASYQIELPNRWNGDVVYFAHGFRGNPPALYATAPPLRRHLIGRGFAWAASSYSRNGYEPGVGALDTFRLHDVFQERVGKPRRSYIYGESMGGNVVTLSLEQYPTAYDGGLSECGVVSGPEVLDYFLSWAALAQYFARVDFVSAAPSAEEVQRRIEDRVLPALGSPAAPTEAGRAFANAIMLLTGGPRPLFWEGYEDSFEPNFSILANAVALAGPSSAAAQNARTDYAIDPGFGVSGEQLNREIDRFVSAPSYRDRQAYPEFQPMSGEIRRPLLTLHGTGDLLVPISLEQSYRRAVDNAGRGHLLVQRSVRRAGHCNFSAQERERAFDDLVRWVEGGQRPDGEDLRGDLRGVGARFTAPPESAGAASVADN